MRQVPNHQNIIICLDVGNSNIFGGVFEAEQFKFSFRHDTKQYYTADQLGLFLKNVLTENQIDSSKISHIVICSVVPHLDYSLQAACIKYFNITPFILQAGVKTGIQIKYRNPLEVGTDRIAAAVAATHFFPDQNIIVIDFGTATTFGIISNKKEFLGGLILPGMRTGMESLQSSTAKLPMVKIVTPSKLIGDSTIECIQSGLYYGQLSAAQKIIEGVTKQLKGKKPIVIGTGGFAYLFDEENIFTQIIPTLVLDGLRLTLQLNTQKLEKE